jgi:hypothetical protein
MPTQALCARRCEPEAGIGLATCRCGVDEVLVDAQLRCQVRDSAVAGDDAEENGALGAVRARA